MIVKRRLMTVAATVVVALSMTLMMVLMQSVSAETNGTLTIIDDFNDGNVGDWGYFGGSDGGGGYGVADDRPYEGSHYLSTGWGGLGGGGFYGGLFKNFDNAQQVTPPANPELSFWVYNQSNASSTSYRLEITIREDLDGNGWGGGTEESFRLDTTFLSPSYNDSWVQITAPLSEFMRVDGAGDGTFNGNLDEIVIVIAGVEGVEPATVEVDFDQFAFAEGAPGPTIIDDFNDGNVDDWGYFGGSDGGGGYGVANDRPYEGSHYLSTGWGGIGGGGFYGGLFKNFDNAQQVTPPADPYLSFWVYNQSNASSTTYRLEITIREDLDGNGWGGGTEESFRLDTTFLSANYNDMWVRIAAPLSELALIDGAGDGTFNGNLDEIVIVIAGVEGVEPATVEVDFDQFAFTSGNPVEGVEVGFESVSYNVAEGDTVTVTATLSAASDETVSVNYGTSDGTAVAGDDYVAASGMLTFEPGETAASFTVDIIDDEDEEDAELFFATLSDPVGAELGTASTAAINISRSDQPQLSGKTVIVDDFESGELPSGVDGDGVEIGYITFTDGSPIAITTTTSADAGIDPLPGSSAENIFLDMTADITSFAGAVHAFEDEAVANWISQDWTGYEGVSFWLYGQGAGTDMFIDLLDNRNPGSTTDDAERFTYTFVDDFTGWQFFQIPFEEFTRKEIGNGAPNDGLTLSETHGWALGSLGTDGEETHYIDDFGLMVRVTIVDDFESGELPYGVDPDGIDVGFYTFSDGSPIAITTTTTADAGIDPLPGTAPENIVLDMTGDVVSFAGFIHAFTDETASVWLNQDWSSYEGVCFWLYGQGSGTDMFIDILDNRSPGSDSDDAERFTFTFVDDFNGWQFFQIPFEEFSRKEIGNGAPNDGFTLFEVHGWALGSLNSGGVETHFIDDFAVYGNTGIEPELRVEFADNQFESVEGTLAEITVQLNMTSTETVQIDYTTAESYATPNRDFIPTSGTLVFEPGIDELSFTIETLEDIKFEGTEGVIVLLSNPISATLGFQQMAILDIIDNEMEDPFLIDDFEGWHPFETSDNISLRVVEIPNSSPFAIPGQGPYEYAVRGSVVAPFGSSSISRSFSEGKNWSSATELSFWYYGTNTGRPIGIELQDNRAPDPGPSGWELVWSDEFNEPAGTQPNPNVWSYEIGDGTLNGIPGWGNDELQYYTDSPDNVAMDGDGNLVITAAEADGSLTCYYGECEYTSGRIITKNKIDFQYGRIESRVKVPSGGDGIPDANGNDFGDGLWPAFWALGDDIDEVGWPQTGEIDIMEFVSREPYEVFGTIHGPGYSGGQSYGDTWTFDDPVSDDFHTFAVEWEPGVIRWYVDDILYHTATPGDVPGEWVFEHPFYLLLNLAVGGNFGGPVGSDTGFPQEMIVDYVRVFQAPDSAERFETNFVDNFTGWQNISVPFADMVRSPNQPAGAPNDGLTLSEVWGYGLKRPSVLTPDSGRKVRFGLDQVRLVCGNQQAVVTNTNDSGPGSLRDAIDSVCDGGTVTFDLGGAFKISLDSSLVLNKNVTIDGGGTFNLTISGQGAIRPFVVDGGVTATLANMAISNGYGFDLAGGILNNGTLTLDNVAVSGNLVNSDAPEFWKGGGGIYNGDGAVLNLVRSTVSGNTTNLVDGGGIYGFTNSTINIDRSTVDGNVAGGVGGGIRSLGNVNIVNSTLSGNTSTAWHGGAIFHTDGAMTVTNSTIVNNSAPDGVTGGVLVATFNDASPTVTFANTIVANNSGSQCAVEDQGGGVPALISADYNLASDESCNLTGDNDLVNVDPLLGSLAFNGGTTRTHMPLVGSPAINAGGAEMCPAVDQRGVDRPQGPACDIGAVEAPPFFETSYLGRPATSGR